MRVLWMRAIPLRSHAIASLEAAPPGSAASDSTAQACPSLYACLKRMCTRPFCDQFMVPAKSLSTMSRCTSDGSIHRLRSTMSSHFRLVPQVYFAYAHFILRKVSPVYTLTISAAQPSRRLLDVAVSLPCHDPISPLQSIIPKYLLSMLPISAA